MSNVNCVLNIMKDNGYIEIKKHSDGSYIKITDMVKDDNIRKEMYKKIYQKMKDSDKYLIDEEENSWNPNFCKKETIYELVINFIESKEECREINFMPKYIRDFVNSSFPQIEMEAYKIYNHYIKEKRLKKEKEQDEKALELLNDIL